MSFSYVEYSRKEKGNEKNFHDLWNIDAFVRGFFGVQ